MGQYISVIENVLAIALAIASVYDYKFNGSKDKINVFGFAVVGTYLAIKSVNDTNVREVLTMTGVWFGLMSLVITATTSLICLI